MWAIRSGSYISLSRGSRRCPESGTARCGRNLVPKRRWRSPGKQTARCISGVAYGSPLRVGGGCHSKSARLKWILFGKTAEATRKTETCEIFLLLEVVAGIVGC